jgi:hypothetical protein
MYFLETDSSNGNNGLVNGFGDGESQDPVASGTDDNYGQ